MPKDGKEREGLRFYVIADPHGFFSTTEEALTRAGFFADSEPHRLIVCGDVLDRGTEAVKLTELLLTVQRRGELIYVQGNHEDLMMQCLQEVAKGNAYEIACGMSHHYSNGTWDTLLQLADMSARAAVEDPHELIRRVRNSAYYRELMPHAIGYYETENYIFCHGWIPTRIKRDGEKTEYEYLEGWRENATVEEWKRSRWLNGMSLACEHGIREVGKTVVCGHFHTSYGHSRISHACTEWDKDAIFKPFYADGIIALDACTAYTGRVNCIVLEDGEL